MRGLGQFGEGVDGVLEPAGGGFEVGSGFGSFGGVDVFVEASEGGVGVGEGVLDGWFGG